MRLYHGSEHIVRQPKYGIGNRNNDYGLGFYCTEDKSLAMEWATNSDKGGYANEYDFSTEGMSILDLSIPEYNILNWLAILLENRTFECSTHIAEESKAYILDNFMIPYKEVDIIKGYRADDSYFTFAKMFLNNSITLDQLSRAMKLGNLGEQVVLKSERAFSRIKCVEALQADYLKYSIKRKNRDQLAREEFVQMKISALNGIFVTDIIRERWSKDDERLQ